MRGKCFNVGLSGTPLKGAFSDLVRRQLASSLTCSCYCDDFDFPSEQLQWKVSIPYPSSCKLDLLALNFVV